MSRATRLLALLDALRAHRRPVTGAVLAAELGVSLRTLYRDIDTLRSEGAAIDGEAGVGFVMAQGLTLPPLMFSQDEVDALALGLRWVMERADPGLAASARRALARVAAVLPESVRAEMDLAPLVVGPGEAPGADDDGLPALRRAIRGRERLVLTYQALDGRTTRRTVWPLALAFFDRARVLAAWCELRQDFRHFRTDRIAAVEPTGTRYAGRRSDLVRRWRDSVGAAPPAG